MTHAIKILGVQEKLNGNTAIELSIIVNCSKYLQLAPFG